MSKSSSNIVLIVDPFSTGTLIAPMLQQQGYACYAVQSSSEVGRGFIASYEGVGFQDAELHAPEAIMQRFAPGDVHAVLTGAESGTYCAESLAAHYQVPGNNPASSDLRRAKGAMQAQLAQTGLDHIRSQPVTPSNAETLDIWHSASGYVLKPDNACGTEDVRFYADSAQVRQAIQTLPWGKTNLSGERNEQYLLQERLLGEEYVVDLMLGQDFVRLCSLCKYQKGLHNGSAFVYENLQVLDVQDPEFQSIIDYAVQAAHALGVRWGPAHLEIMNTARGPVLIELGARLHGGIAPRVFEACYEPGLLESLGDLVNGRLSSGSARQLKKARIVFLINEQEGRRAASVSDLEHRLLAVPGVGIVKLFMEAGEIVPLTTDLANCPGIAAVLADSEAQLDEAERMIRGLGW